MMKCLPATGKKRWRCCNFCTKKFNVKICGSLNLNNIQAVSVYFSMGTKKLSMTCVYIPLNATTIAAFGVLSTYLE